jgi:O-antigen/teichoic acid export membrane protein
MTSDLFQNESRDDKNIGSRKIIQPSPLISFSKEEQHSLDAAMENGQAPEIDDISTDELLVVDVDHLPTQVNLKTVHESLSHSIMLDGLPIDEQQTWILPVARDSRKTTNIISPDLEMQGYVSLIRNLVKSSGIYAIASLAAPLVSLILAPFLTHSVSRADYGALAVLNTVIALGAGITQLGLSSAFFRAYNYDYETQKDRLGIFSTVVILLSLISLPTSIAATITAPRLSMLLFNSPAFSDTIRFAALVILLQNLSVPAFAWLRAESRAGFFSLLSIVNLLITLSATLIFVGALHLGIAGSLLAIGSGYAFVVVCSLPLILLRSGLQFRFDIARNLLSFGVPLVFNFASYWVLQLSDRYLLSRFGTLAQTASYAVAYSLGTVLSVVVLTPFVMAWPTAMFAIAKRDDAARVFRLVFRWFSIVLLLATFALSLISIGVLDVLFPVAYHSAAPIIPIIALSIMFFGVYNVFSIGVGVRRKTWLTAILMTFAALVNVSLNIVLIPHYGSMGAALSTLIAYAFLALVSYIVNQRIYPIPFEIGMFIIGLLIGIAFYLGSDFLAQTREIYLAWGIRIAALCLYSGCLMLLGKFATWREKKTYRQTPEVSRS